MSSSLRAFSFHYPRLGVPEVLMRLIGFIGSGAGTLECELANGRVEGIELVTAIDQSNSTE